VSRAAVSNFVYGIYLVCLSLTLFAIPDLASGLVGLPGHKDVWVYIAAMAILVQSIYFFVSAWSESTNFFRASVPLRYLVPVFFAAFAALNLTKFSILFFTPPDIIFATWTWFALVADERAKHTATMAVVA
jgi:hypothetical protein